MPASAARHFYHSAPRTHGKVATRCVKYCHKSAPPSPPFNCNLVKHVQSRSVDRPVARNCSPWRLACDNVLSHTHTVEIDRHLEREALPHPARWQAFEADVTAP